MRGKIAAVIIGFAVSCSGQSPSGRMSAQGLSGGVETKPSFYGGIRKHIAAGDFDEAGRGIDEVLSSLPPEDGQCAATVDLVVSLIGELPADRAGEMADLMGAKALRAAATTMETQSLRYEILERALLRGQYSLVTSSEQIETPERRPAYDGHAIDVLRARASARAFETARSNAIAAGSLDKDRSNLKRLSGDCTRLHERALASATGELDRARIAAEWWQVRLLPGFVADSRAMRNTFPFTRVPLTEEGERRAQKQVTEFREAVRDALANPPTGKAMPEDVRGVLAQKLGDEFERLAVLGVPDAEFKVLLKGLPDFCDIGMPIGRVTSVEQAELTTRWYMWRAVIQRPVSLIEQQTLDAQVEEVASFLEQEIDRKLTTPRTQPGGRVFADRFRQSYRRLKDNRFVPYYKEAYSYGDRQRLWNQLKKELDFVTRQHVRKVDGLMKQGKTVSDDEFQDLQQESIELLRIALHGAVSEPAIPNSCPLSEQLIFRSGGHLNRCDIYIFRVISTLPLPPNEVGK